MIVLRQCQSYGRLMTDVYFTKQLAKNARFFLGYDSLAKS